MVSEYNFQSTVQGRVPVGMTLPDWWAEFVDLRDTLPFLHDNHLRPQVEFVGPETHVFRLEDGPDGMIDLVEARTGRALERAAFGRANPRSDPDPDLYEAQELAVGELPGIGAHFARDFDAFGYGADPARRFVTHVPRPALARSRSPSLSRVARQRLRRRAWRQVVRTARLPVAPY